MKTPISWIGSSQMMTAGAIITGQRQNGIACSESMSRHLLLKSLKPSHHQVRCCSPSFSASKVHYLLNSSSIEEPITSMCTVRHSKAYSDPPKTKTEIAHQWCGFASR
ncbi:hypothetical protein TNCV_615461 [Trichonephila clavipes]|nr:hypothetical protein TNCV_615461 [Trichonephila clavipes]